MKKLVLLLLGISIATTGLLGQTSAKYKKLFNGKDLSGWTMPGNIPGFEVKEGILMAVPPNGSDLFTEAEYGNYSFKFEYLLSEVGNSGVLIRCNTANPWDTGVEVQLLAPWTPYRDDLHCTASLYGHVAITNRPDESTNVWHTMEIVCNRKLISVFVDGKMATHVDIDTVQSMDKKLMAGVIGFQSNHSKAGEFAYFRNIQIQNFDEDKDYVSKGFYDDDPRVRTQALNAAVDLGVPMVGALIEMLDDSNTMVEAGAKQALFNIVAEVTGQQTPQEIRVQLVEELIGHVGKSESTSVNEYLQWLTDLAKTVIQG